MERAHIKLWCSFWCSQRKRQRAGDILWFHRGDKGASLWSVEVALFRCQWVWLEEINTDSEGFTTIDLTKTAYKDDPFVLARDVMQVFYARDNKTKGRLKVVLEGKRKTVGVDGVIDEEDNRSYQEMPPFGTNVPLPILQEGDEPAYVRIDHNEALMLMHLKIVRYC